MCSGGSYTFPDGTTQDNIESTVVHTSNLTSVLGCDSVIQTTVSAVSEFNEDETVAICYGGSHTFPDGTIRENITSTISHISNLKSIQGCDSIVETTLKIKPVYNLADTQSVCRGGSYTFPDGTMQENITSTLKHTSSLTSSIGCDSVIETILHVTEVDTAVNINNGTLTASSGMDMYQWIDCENSYSVIDGALNRSYAPGTSGTYAVIVTSSSCFDTSACYQVFVTGIHELAISNNVRIFPNPAHNRVTVKADNPVGVKIINKVGQVLYWNNEQMEHKIEVESYRKGVYIIIVEDGNGFDVRKLIIE